MPFGSVARQNDALDNIVDGWPASGARWALFTGVPVAAGGTGVEFSDAGYSSPAFAPSDFAAAASAAKAVVAPINFGTSADAIDDPGTHWAIIDASDVIVFWDDLPDSALVTISAAATPIETSPYLLLGNSASVD